MTSKYDDDEDTSDIKPLSPRKYSIKIPRRRSSFADARSVEANFNREPRPSLMGSGSYSLTLSWDNLSVAVTIPAKKSMFCKEIQPATERVILKDVSGVVTPGNLVAIMGASGSGKTTLLNVLTNRNIKDYSITGKFRLNGVEVKDGVGIKNVSAYVQQNDLFISTLTVREHLQFRAILRMDKHLDREARLRRVEEVIVEMGLTKCADNRIGTPGGSKKGISGGEKKRLSFASEALTSPPIFFCDEPTSSLDSFMAQTIVHTLQNMANKGATILCTIHQPSSELFAMFNKLILLSEGRVAFMGDSNDALDFFANQQYPCPDNFNPADHYILTLAIEPGKEEECRRKTGAICDKFVESSANKEQLEVSTELKKSADDVDNAMVRMVTSFAEASRYEVSSFVQLRMLFWRSWISQFRNPTLFQVRIIQTIAIGVLIGLIYLDIDISQTGVQNVNGSLFLILVNISFTCALAVCSAFPDEITIVMREYGTGLYRLDTYFVPKSLAEMPVFILTTAIFVAITYWMIGLNSSFGAFCECTGTVVLVCIISGAFGYFISIACGETQVALSVLSPAMIPLILFAGLFLNDDDIPDYFIWLKYLSWFRYGYEILSVNQWEDVESIDCDGNGTVCPYGSGMDVLDSLSMDKDRVHEDVGLLFVLFGSLYIVAYIALYLRGRRSKE